MKLNAGTVAAGRRMAELRDRKRRLAKSEAIQEWSRRTGRSTSEWWKAAQEAGLDQNSTIEQRIAFLRGE